jgi:hypothetical protein
VWSFSPVVAMRKELVKSGALTAALEMLERDSDLLDRELGPADGPKLDRLPAVERAKILASEARHNAAGPSFSM